MNQISIRRAQTRDLAALLAIYNHYVLSTHVTFDIEPRTVEQRRAWLEGFCESGRHQCFVAAKNGVAIGWACSLPLKDRAAYDTSVETSVYLAPGETGQGLGRRLYEILFEVLAREDIHRMFAGVALPNDASIALHEKMGFGLVGTYTEVGRKFGRYWDVSWYGRGLD